MKMTTWLVALMFLVLSGCGGGGMQEIPVNPAALQAPGAPPAEFRLGAGDSIDIKVFRHDELARSVKIDTSGRIQMPLLGSVTAAGRDAEQLRQELEKGYGEFIVNPQVMINITTVQSQKYHVLGEVNSPGTFYLDSRVTVLEAISKAQGVNTDAELANVIVVRPGEKTNLIAKLDLKQTVGDGDFSQNWEVRSGDVIYVPAQKIASVARFFNQLAKIISPIVSLETGISLWPDVEDVINNRDTGDSRVVIPTN